MRGLAVLLVVLFHAGLPVRAGFIGVDVFFVISGFVITALILDQRRNGEFGFREFYSRRIRRLWPALAVTVTVATLASTVLLSPFGSQQITAQTGIGATLLLANVVIPVFSGGYFDVAADSNALLNTWSLSVEEQFYLAFPFVLVLALGRAPMRKWRLAAVVLAVLTMVSFLLSLALSSAALPGLPESWQQTLAFFMSPTRAWEFGVGAMLALGAGRLAELSSGIRSVLGWLGFSAVVLSALLITSQDGFPGWIGLVPVLGAAAMISAGTGARNPVGLLNSHAASWLGDRSYSWYLWHWPLIVFAGVAFDHARWALIAAAVASLVPAMISYRWVENRFRVVPSGQPAKTRALAIWCVLVPVVASLLVLQGSRNFWWLPSVQQAGSQIVPLHPDASRGCDKPFKVGELAGANCTWNEGASNAPMYLIGDSKIGQWTEAAVEAGDREGRPVMLSVEQGCPFFTGRSSRAGQVQAACSASAKKNLAALAQAPPGTVYLSTSSLYLSRPSFGLENPQTGEMATDTEEKTQIYGAALEGYVSTLKEAGHEVVLVQENVRFPGWTVQDCPMLEAIRDVSLCGASVTRQEALRAREPLDAINSRVASRKGAALLDPFEELCPGEVCVTDDRGFWRSRDESHISVGQSQASWPLFSQER